MTVIKRNGSKEEFDGSKIVKAVKKAFDSVSEDVPTELQKRLNELIKHYSTEETDTTVEQIQDAVEILLMSSSSYKAAKAFILYREQHKQLRLIKNKLRYIHQYTESSDSAVNLSNTDSNANSNKKNAATLESELYKDTSRLVQRSQIVELLKLIESPYVNQYVEDLEHHILYNHDESCPVLKPYCSAYTMYPLVMDGTNTVDGTRNHAPKYLSSFCGQFQNLVFLLSAQKKGAGAYGEFFNFFSYFCEKEWGEKYYEKADTIITNEHCLQQRTIGQTIDQYFQSVTHYINQPAGNRGYQSPFTNFNIFDSYYWHTMFDDFYFPDGTQPHWDAVNWLQKRYMKWLNEERTKTLLTFPVMTVCCLTDGKDVLDKEYKDFITTQWAEGDSFFAYLSENADSISSCCRLRNEVTDNTFSSTTGLTGVQTGSCNVMTLNLNRIVQDWARLPRKEGVNFPGLTGLDVYLENILKRVYDYQKAYKTGLYIMDAQGMFPQTKAGYISLDKLYCTIGINGLNEAARFMGYKVSNNKDYLDFVAYILNVIKKNNEKYSEKKFRFNLELVPAESLGVKNYNWDKQDGYVVPDDENLYNSYIYEAHDSTSILDKIAMQGGEIAKAISGGY